MSKIKLRISHALLMAVAGGAFQGGYSYFSNAGSVFNARLALTALFTGLMTGLFGYLLAKTKEPNSGN